MVSGTRKERHEPHCSAHRAGHRAAGDAAVSLAADALDGPYHRLRIPPGGSRVDLAGRDSGHLLAVVVLFFSLGPSDVGEEVDAYCRALDADDEEQVHNAAKAIVEDDVPDDPRARTHAVEAAVCVQANNRLFAVIFWFVVLGPLAAWAYRATDLVRRRAVFNEARDQGVESSAARIREAAETVHGWVAWIPARLTAVGYAAAGHMDDAIAALRAPTEDRDLSTSDRSEHLLARVGIAALALQDLPDETPNARAIRGAMAANHLVFKLLLIWAVIIAAMTLYGFTQ
jgi:AmpE protein